MDETQFLVEWMWAYLHVFWFMSIPLITLTGLAVYCTWAWTKHKMYQGERLSREVSRLHLLRDKKVALKEFPLIK